MKRKSLLFLLLMAMFTPLAVNGQNETFKKSRARSASPVLEGNIMMTSSNDKGNRDATYEMVTSDQSDWSGNYILGINYSTDYVIAFDGSLMSSSIYGYTAGGIAELTADGNTITSIGDAALLSIAPITYNGSTYYTIQINGNNYLGSSTSGFATNTSANSSTYYWNISYSNSGMILYSVATTNSYRIRFFEETDSSGDNYVGFSNTSNLAYSGSTFEYYNITLYKETTTSDNYVWVETTTITPGEEYLIGLVSGSDVYLVLNYAPNQTNHYYYSSSSNWWGYTALAAIDGDGHITGCTGNATDLQYAQWIFSSSTGGTITSNYESNRILYGTTNSSYTDLYPASSSSYSTTWTYSNNRLSYNSNYYLYLNSSNYIQRYSTGTTVKLYTKQLVETGYTVNASTTITNGSILFSTNGGVDWYDNLSNVAAGETVVISVQPETGYELSGTPIVTPTCNVTGSGNLYSFVMPESDVTVNATFNCITPADPTFSVAAGTYTSAQNVSISCATAGATIYYTTDGSTPNSSSTQYTGAITINSTTTLKAIAYNGSCTSNVTTATYTMDLPTYTVTCTTDLTGGNIAASPTLAVEGTTITVTATPESGYFLGTITVTDANNNIVTVMVNGNVGTFTMPASNVTVTATFTQGFHVTLNQTPNGTISADQTTNLQPGDIVTLTATPDNDCVFVAWYIYKSGNPRDVIAAVNNSWFFMPSSDVTVQAVFVTEESHEQTVGGGDNTNSNLPTNVYMKYSLTQQIYTAAEIGYTGRITAIAFKANGAATRTLEVYMAHTDLTAFSSTTSWETMGSVSKVFSGSVSFSSSDWTTITLDTPFEYDGTSNLNICVADRTGSWVSTITFNTYGTSANRALYINDDNTDYGAGVGYAQTLSGYAGTQSMSNNQIKFTIKVAGSAESLTISPDEINDFSYLEGQGPSETHKLDIVGVDLENNITLSAPTNFEISLTEDGTYTSSVTIPRETGSKGRGMTTWDFEGSMDGWTTIDADGDGHNWMLGSESVGVYCVNNNPFANGAGPNGSSDGLVTASYSNYLGVLTPDNWIVSPQVTLGGSFSMWTKPYQAQYPNEHFGIYVSTSSDPTNTSSYILLNEWTMTNTNWAQYSVDLSAFVGQTGYIAVRHFNCSDVYVMLADNFVLDTDAAISVEMPVTIIPATVFVRMKDNLSAGTYSGTLTASAGTGDNLNGSVSLSGEVIAPSYTVTLSANPGEGGSVAGAGTYTDGSSVTVSVIAQRPYTFINWTENGEVVSTDASYTFTVNGDRTLVANFGFIKHITGYANQTNPGGYNLIASPIGTVAPTQVTNMITPKDGGNNTYDLYRFQQDPSDGLEWRNYRQGAFNLNVGQGYLYAHRTDVDLVFTGSAISAISESPYEVTLSKTAATAGDGLEFPDWNLVGNPFAETAYIADGRDFYTMTGDGRSFEVSSVPSIEAMEGVFVIAANNDEKMYFTTTEPANTGKSIVLNLGEGRQNIDRAIVRFGEGRTLPKLQLFEGSTKIYIPQDGKDYAVVRSEEMGAMPVNFKAENNGTFSLNVSGQNTEFAYLHLIDNKTGNDVDLLQTPSYSFEAKTTDYESRFKLVFATGDNSNDDNFAFFSNGSFVINNDGTAELQVIDLMGRILSSETINGCTNVNVNAAPGVYMLRLINGDNVKVQKVVVK